MECLFDRELPTARGHGAVRINTGSPKQKEVVDRKTRVMKVCHGVAQGVPDIEIRRTRTYRTVKCLGGRGFVGSA